jgi:hypothetical protein
MTDKRLQSRPFPHVRGNAVDADSLPLAPPANPGLLWRRLPHRRNWTSAIATHSSSGCTPVHRDLLHCPESCHPSPHRLIPVSQAASTRSPSRHASYPRAPTSAQVGSTRPGMSLVRPSTPRGGLAGQNRFSPLAGAAPRTAPPPLAGPRGCSLPPFRTGSGEGSPRSPTPPAPAPPIPSSAPSLTICTTGFQPPSSVSHAIPTPAPDASSCSTSSPRSSQMLLRPAEASPTSQYAGPRAREGVDTRRRQWRGDSLPFICRDG